jgi:hypothetical protein
MWVMVAALASPPRTNICPTATGNGLDALVARILN